VIRLRLIALSPLVHTGVTFSGRSGQDTLVF